MTVYVDDMRARYGRLVMCHMLADTDDELHAMARAIGVARRWWQSPETTAGSHYDVCLVKRAAAVRLGAVEVTMREAAAMNARRRISGALGRPDEAMAWLSTHRGAVARQRAASPLIDEIRNSAVASGRTG